LSIGSFFEQPQIENIKISNNTNILLIFKYIFLSVLGNFVEFYLKILAYHCFKSKKKQNVLI